MEELNRASADAASSSSSLSHSHAGASSSSSNGERSSAVSSSTQVEEEENEGNEAGNPLLIQQRTSVSYDAHLGVIENEEQFRSIQGDTWSCIVVIVTFCFFVSMTMILGVYGSSNILLGPNSSILMRPNPLFVENLKVEELEEASNPPTLYGFYRTPPLDVVTTWSEKHKMFLPGNSHKEWVYFLNKGSQMNVSYNVTSPGPSLIFAIAQGNEALAQWLEDPLYPNSTLLWKTIHGLGMIQQDVYMSSIYYVAVANLNAKTVEVELNLKIRAFLYNTSGAFYKCSLSRGQCNLELPFGQGNIALLTSPSLTLGGGGNQWYVKLSYGPRWMTYIAGIGVMTVTVFVVFHLLSDSECRRRRRVLYGDSRSQRTPLLSNKDDDLSSWGSSYDCVSQDDEDLEDEQAIGSLEHNKTKDCEFNNTRRLCAICFDAPRDCFFLPCGHCVACFACGTRIAEAAGTCPICRRHMKKVRKIFTV